MKTPRQIMEAIAAIQEEVQKSNAITGIDADYIDRQLRGASWRIHLGIQSGKIPDIGLVENETTES